MKTIKEGVPPDTRLWVGTCKVCGWVGEAEEGELAEFSCGEDYYWGCVCPTRSCGRRVEFQRKKEQQ